MDPAGTLVGSSSESRFTFTVQDQRLRRGDYVKVGTEDGLALCKVGAVTRGKEGLVAPVAPRGVRGRTRSPVSPPAAR